MVACFRIGAVVLPCTEQLRARDLRLRLDVARPAAIVCDERNRAELDGGRAGLPGAHGPRRGAVRRRRAARRSSSTPRTRASSRSRAAPRASRRPSSTPSATSPASTCRPSTGSTRARASSCGARPRSGWSKSARNVFIAPWIRGAAALLHDARFDPHERLDGPRPRAGRGPLHGADRVPRDRQARRAAARRRRCAALVAAGEALNPEVLRAFHEATGLWIRDGYGQTETGQLTGMPLGEPTRGRGRWAARCRGCALWIDDGELCLDPTTVPTFFRGYLGADAALAGGLAHRRPRRRGRGRLPALRGPHRRRDHLRRLPDRAVRGRVRARRARRRGRGGRRRGAGRRARRGRARRRRPARRVRRLRRPRRASSRTTSRPRPRRTSTRGSSTSPRICPRRRAGRSAAPCCAVRSGRSRSLGPLGCRRSSLDEKSPDSGEKSSRSHSPAHASAARRRSASLRSGRRPGSPAPGRTAAGRPGPRRCSPR